MIIYDEVLGREEKVQEEITPEIGREIELKDTDSMKAVFEGGDEDAEL